MIARPGLIGCIGRANLGKRTMLDLHSQVEYLRIAF